MGQLSPQEIAILFGAGVLAIVAASALARRLTSRRRPDQAAPGVPPPATPRTAEVHTLRPQPGAEAGPSQPARTAPPSRPAAGEPSYTAIAVAQAARVAPAPGPSAPPVRIDYANEATSVPPGASYAAITVANAARAARGLPPLESAPAAPRADAAASTSSATSYAAIAAATARFTPRAAEQPARVRIDYSDVPAEVLAGASYTAIAIAAAARHG